MVYDRELQYVRRVEHSGLGQFTGVSAANHGNLYVADHANDCTQVFSKRSCLPTLLGCDCNGMMRLNDPHYVYVIVAMCRGYVHH